MSRDGDTPSIGERIAEAWLVELELSDEFNRPWMDAAVDWLLGDGPAHATEMVVDVGCGAGGAACAIAGRLPAGAQVVGLDRDPRLLAIGQRRARDEGVDGRITWTTADVGRLPVQPNSVDLAWASGVVHHLPDQQEAVVALAGLLRAGGRVALVEGGLPLRCLPYDIGLGRPGLEARLDEARARWFADMRGELHGPAMPYGWPDALARAGLVDITCRSFVAERTPPLDEVGRAMAERHLRSALDELGERLAPDDRATLRRLLAPDDAAYVGRRRDLMVSALHTIHTGRAPA
jgi:SAM-dependent methyltransferase